MSVRISPSTWIDFARDVVPSTHPVDLAHVAEQPQWRRAQMLNARGLLRTLLTQVAPASADADFAYAANGKPILVGWPQVGISWSHDNDTVAVAVCMGRQVGIDVQLPAAPPDERLVRRCLRERAGELLCLPASEQAQEFAWIWSVQEACVKCDGSGLAGQPWAIDVPLRPQQGQWRAVSWITLRNLTALPISCALGEALC